MRAGEQLDDGLAHLVELGPELLEHLGGHTLALMDEAEQDVLRADVVVVEQPGLFLGQDHHPSGSIGEPLEQGSQSPDAATALPVPEAPR
jgi:hypothetical protein